jgi:peptidoglycan hydrolase-like protein with peptidoglycan-binding domain
MAAGLTCPAGLPAATTPPKKPAPPTAAPHITAPRKTVPHKTAPHKTAAASAPGNKKTTAARRTSHKPAAQKVPARSAWHPGQTAPTPERYKEIQEALAQKGYLHGEASGVWNPDSADALRRFQQDQNLQASGKLDSLSIIALGLGPKH